MIMNYFKMVLLLICFGFFIPDSGNAQEKGNSIC